MAKEDHQVSRDVGELLALLPKDAALELPTAPAQQWLAQRMREKAAQRKVWAEELLVYAARFQRATPAAAEVLVMQLVAIAGQLMSSPQQARDGFEQMKKRPNP